MLRQIKTFRGANELFSAAFVSSSNQSPQVAVSVTTYAAAALSLQNAQIHSASVCVRARAARPFNGETMFLSAGTAARHMSRHLKGHPDPSV